MEKLIYDGYFLSHMHVSRTRQHRDCLLNVGPQIVLLLSKRKQNLTEEDLLKLSDYSTRREGRKVIRYCAIMNLFLGLCSLWNCLGIPGSAKISEQEFNLLIPRSKDFQLHQVKKALFEYVSVRKKDAYFERVFFQAGSK